ncbi:HlyD family secretion protein [Macrococcoides caseolyticum]|uniref:HlyD family secretion protein n=1 Tax=Macrococcoides caseolyticum TaxID=69966 RepID=UPI000CD1164B|nr:HlyD family secretion protein [Macrococcus caseolyticus]PNZ71599.1 HlyD family secretion protein [Macrococcus caseolyticus]
MKKLYSFEDFQDSTVYFNNAPSKFIARSLLILIILFISLIISLFFILKTDYIKSEAVISPKDKPMNVSTDRDVKINKILKQDGQFVQRKDHVIILQEMTHDKEELLSKIQFKKEKLEGLSLLYDKIDNYPSETDKKITKDYGIKYFEIFKQQYNQIHYLDETQRNNLKSQSLQTLIEKIDALKDEIYDLSSIKISNSHDNVNNSGYIFYSEDIQEGSVVPKGDILYKIYPNNDKEIITYISSEDIISLKQNQKVSINFKSKKDKFYIDGEIKHISKFPEETKNNQIFYKVTVSLKNKIPKKLENVYFLKGTAFIEMGRETIAQYLYRKIKE